MDNTVLAVIITGLFSAASAVISAVATSKVTAFRIKALEDKVEKHNNVVERVVINEQSVKSLWRSVDEIKDLIGHS